MDCLAGAFFSLVAGTTGFWPSWSDNPSAREIVTCAKDFGQAVTSLKEFDDEHDAVLETLAHHKQRIEHIVQRNNAIVVYMSQSLEEEAKGDLELMEERNQELSTALTATEARIQILKERRNALSDQYEAALAKLLESLPDSHRSAHTAAAVQCTIDDEMLRSQTLDRFAEDCIQLEALMAEEAQRSPPMSGEPWMEDEIDYELRAEQNVTQQLKMDWAGAYAAKQALEASSDPANVQDQLEELTEQVRSLGVQLALRGMPIRDGEWIGELCDPENVPYSPVIAEVSDGIEQHCFRNTGHVPSGLDDDEDLGSPEQMPQYERGLFDEVAGIDKPSANQGNDDEVPMTEDQYRAMVNEKIVPRVLKWLDDIEVDDSEGPPISDELDVSLVTLTHPNIEDSLSCVVEAPALPPSQCFELETRRQAWRIQLANDRRDVALMVKKSSPWIELPPGFEEWASERHSESRPDKGNINQIAPL